MFCTNCGSALPEKGAKFCPNCGVRLFSAEPLVSAAEVMPELPLEVPANEPVETACEAAEVFEKAPEEIEKVSEELPETLEEAVETFETVPEEQPAEVIRTEPEEAVVEPSVPVSEPLAAPALASPAPDPAQKVPDEIPEPVSPEAEPVRKLHFTAIISIVFTALSCLFFFLALLALLVNMHPVIMILSSVCLLCNTPFAFAFGVAAFIVGLKKKHPATWIIGLVAAILAIVSFFAGFITLITSIVYAAV